MNNLAKLPAPAASVGESEREAWKPESPGLGLGFDLLPCSWLLRHCCGPCVWLPLEYIQIRRLFVLFEKKRRQANTQASLPASKPTSQQAKKPTKDTKQATKKPRKPHQPISQQTIEQANQRKAPQSKQQRNQRNHIKPTNQSKPPPPAGLGQPRTYLLPRSRGPKRPRPCGRRHRANHR